MRRRSARRRVVVVVWFCRRRRWRDNPGGGAAWRTEPSSAPPLLGRRRRRGPQRRRPPPLDRSVPAAPSSSACVRHTESETQIYTQLYIYLISGALITKDGRGNCKVHYLFGWIWLTATMYIGCHYRSMTFYLKTEL